MSWFDVLVCLLVAAVVALEMRQDAGRSVLDTVAAIAAVQVSGHFGAPLTAHLGWKPFPGTHVSPLAQGLLFLVLWAVGLGLSLYVHRQTRWSMDQFDPVFGLVFGLVIAGAAGHVLCEVTMQAAVMDYGKLPGYLRNSCFAEELRSFQSYHYVLDTFSAAQDSRWNR